MNFEPLGQAMAEHTPTPWNVSKHHGYGELNGVQIRDATGYAIAVSIGDVEELDSRANAEFIVRACNSHDALVKENANLKKALILALSQMDTWRLTNKAYFDAVNYNWINSPKTVDAIQTAVTAALATAEPTGVAASHDSNRGDAQS